MKKENESVKLQDILDVFESIGMKVIPVGFDSNDEGGPFGTDRLYPDGSKDYGTCGGDIIFIKRPEVVNFIEDILQKGFTGYGYMPTLEEGLNSGFLTQDEYRKIVRILD